VDKRNQKMTCMTPTLTYKTSKYPDRKAEPMYNNDIRDCPLMIQSVLREYSIYPSLSLLDGVGAPDYNRAG